MSDPPAESLPIRNNTNLWSRFPEMRTSFSVPTDPQEEPRSTAMLFHQPQRCRDGGQHMMQLWSSVTSWYSGRFCHSSSAKCSWRKRRVEPWCPSQPHPHLLLLLTCISCGAAVSWRACIPRHHLGDWTVIFMCPCDSEHMGSFIACVCFMDQTFSQTGCWSRGTVRADPADGRGEGVWCRTHPKGKQGQTEAEWGFCVFACWCFVFHSVHLNFSAATLVCGYPSALLGGCETLVFLSHIRKRKWSGFQDFRVKWSWWVPGPRGLGSQPSLPWFLVGKCTR